MNADYMLNLRAANEYLEGRAVTLDHCYVHRAIQRGDLNCYVEIHGAAATNLTRKLHGRERTRLDGFFRLPAEVVRDVDGPLGFFGMPDGPGTTVSHYTVVVDEPDCIGHVAKPLSRADFRIRFHDLKAYSWRILLKHALTPRGESASIEGAKTSGRFARTSTSRKSPLSQVLREECRKVAEEIWKREGTLTIEDMIDRPEILAVLERGGKGYTRGTLRRWIKDLCPNRHPGRRKKN